MQPPVWSSLRSQSCIGSSGRIRCGRRPFLPLGFLAACHGLRGSGPARSHLQGQPLGPADPCVRAGLSITKAFRAAPMAFGTPIMNGRPGGAGSPRRPHAANNTRRPLPRAEIQGGAERTPRSCQRGPVLVLAAPMLSAGMGIEASISTGCLARPNGIVCKTLLLRENRQDFPFGAGLHL